LFFSKIIHELLSQVAQYKKQQEASSKEILTAGASDIGVAHSSSTLYLQESSETKINHHGINQTIYTAHQKQMNMVSSKGSADLNQIITAKTGKLRSRAPQT
jgi:hypothetical protein